MILEDEHGGQVKHARLTYGSLRRLVGRQALVSVEVGNFFVKRPHKLILYVWPLGEIVICIPNGVLDDYSGDR